MLLVPVCFSALSLYILTRETLKTGFILKVSFPRPCFPTVPNIFGKLVNDS